MKDIQPVKRYRIVFRDGAGRTIGTGISQENDGALAAMMAETASFAEFWPEGTEQISFELHE